MNRREILDTANDIINGDRNRDYGEPIDNFTRTAKLLSGYLGIELGPVDVAVIQILLKVDRIKTSPEKEDHWVDIAGYSACGGECAAIEEARNSKE